MRDLSWPSTGTPRAVETFVDETPGFPTHRWLSNARHADQDSTDLILRSRLSRRQCPQFNPVPAIRVHQDARVFQAHDRSLAWQERKVWQQ
jgi:hypothetical protein